MSFIKNLLLVTALLGSGLAWAVPVDINTADAQTLETLNGIGPSKAAAIVEYRKANGPFKTVDDLSKVKGVGEKLVDKNRTNLAVGNATAAQPGKSAATKK